jgi:hypothetical protein
MVPVAHQAIVNTQAGANMAAAGLNPVGGTIFRFPAASVPRGFSMNGEPMGHVSVTEAHPVGAMRP